ncbi:hypothetical protein WJX74_006645 [Apatococcus lobatus]|uniref:Uncharacterized protein n=1 Tax=Apatococcus lobatus TaxID=904363 RepID=A0AAW1RSW7_9CHLO
MPARPTSAGRANQGASRTAAGRAGSQAEHSCSSATSSSTAGFNSSRQHWSDYLQLADFQPKEKEHYMWSSPELELNCGSMRKAASAMVDLN